MIPLKLQIKNFLSYGSPTQEINFEPYHLICLSGKNGHGKSALLDALTWAVWGQARKTVGTAKADEGLLRLGQSHMVVSLDFACNGHIYRVRREYTHDRGKGVAQLDFGVIDKETERLRPLTDKTIRATQAKIEETIGLDFDSFVNSVFLRQGNSNEFSKKTPKERKEILATILGLGKFELLRKRALEKIRDGGITSAHLARLCEHLKLDTATAESVQEQVKALQAQYAQLVEQESGLKDAQKNIVQQRKGLLEQQQEQQRLLFSHEQLLNTCAQQEQSLKALVTAYRMINRQRRASSGEFATTNQQQLEQELQQIQAVVSKRLELTQKSMLAAEKKQGRAQHLQHEQLKLQQAQTQVCLTLETKHQTLLAEERALETAMHTHKQELERIMLELQTLQPLIQNYKEREAQLKAHEALFERRKSFYHKFVSQGNQLAQELKQTKHKQMLAHDEDNPSCSLCEQNLSASRRRFLQTKFTAHEQLLQHQITRLTGVLARLKQLLTEQHQELETFKTYMAQAQQAQLKTNDLTKAHERVTSQLAAETQKLTEAREKSALSHKEVATGRTQLAAVSIAQEELLKRDALYQELVIQQQTVEQELAAHAYDPIYHEQLKEKLAQLQKHAADHAELMREIALQPQRKLEIHAAIVQLRQLRGTAAILKEQLVRFEPLIQSLAQCDAQEHELTTKAHAIASEKEQIAHKRGALEQESIRLEKQRNTLIQEEAHLKQLETDIEEYQILAQALSKDGIQGLLIEHVLPEIEQEANQLLSKLTNNQAHLMIESLRDLKSGGAKETLDIKISDAMGIRPYELFSGGEAFRIDFALRLAISKLLARRNGTSLQTLIIDEGFGSQDEEGLNNIMECLYAIQEEFAKIIIVSHLPSMKEQFPTHFYISKNPRGSTVQVIEQG